MTDGHNDIDGFDPLGTDADHEGGMSLVFEDASRRIVHNILKCYTGYFDVFSEMIQNSLDAVEARLRRKEPQYKPQIWLEVDIPGAHIRIVDNGIGMNRDEFKFCLRPSVSFKKQTDLRGHKGVGATFLAYGFSFIKLQSKQDVKTVSAILRQGRQWAEDTLGTIPRPKLESSDFIVPELLGENSGTCTEILIGQSSGERPKNLSWIGAQSAQQWLDVLRIKTPLGGVYLSTPPFKPTVHIKVKAAEGTLTSVDTDQAEYYYPHEIPNLKTQSLSDIQKASAAIAGDSATVFTKLDSSFKRLDCIYDIWDKDKILKEDSLFASAIDDPEKLLIERHSVIVYACFLRSAKLWSEFNDEILKLRHGQKIIHGGLQIASDFMPQGDLSIIPLTSSIGYQANSHVIVHFTDGDPDMGRKTFQPELKELAEILSVRAVNTMKRYLQHMKPDTGVGTITPDRELYEWKKTQEGYRERKPLSFKNPSGQQLAIVSMPQQEQDVVALFHELIGMGVMKGYRFFATSQSDRYDSLFFMDYQKAQNLYFEIPSNKLGINRSYELPYVTEPKVLEYKYSFESLVRDFDKEEKFSQQIDFVVCWTVGKNYKEKIYLQSLLVGDEGSTRQIYGATHQAFVVGSTQPTFEVLVLEDLLNWLRSPTDEEAHQKRAYMDA